MALQRSVPSVRVALRDEGSKTWSSTVLYSTLQTVSVLLTLTLWSTCLSFLLEAVETIPIKPKLALTLEGSQSIDTSGIDVTWRGAALIYINTGTPIKTKLVATLALAAMATRQVHALRMSTTCAQALSTLIYVITVASIPSITSGTLAVEGLALQWDTLGRGVAVVVSSVAGVHQLRPNWLDSDWADLVGDGVSQDPLLFDIHHKRSLHGDLQRLHGGGAVVMPTVAVGDVLFQLEGEGLGPSLG